jgi:hypothetical protein
MPIKRYKPEQIVTMLGECSSINVSVIRVPGKMIFVTES